MGYLRDVARCKWEKVAAMVETVDGGNLGGWWGHPSVRILIKGKLGLTGTRDIILVKTWVLA